MMCRSRDREVTRETSGCFAQVMRMIFQREPRLDDEPKDPGCHGFLNVAVMVGILPN